MVLALLTPVMQIGYEIRYELGLIAGANRIGELRRCLRAHPPLLPEQRADNQRIIECRKAEALLLSVRHGAVRR